MKKLILYTIACFLLFTSACKETEENEVLPDLPSSQKEFLTFSFLKKNNAEHLEEDYTFTVLGDHINVMFPPGQVFDSLIASFTSNTDSVMIDSVKQISDTTINDFTKPVTYTLVAEDSSASTYRIDIHAFTGLPVLYINTRNNEPITSKDNYINGNITLVSNGNGDEELTDMDMEIRGRGNTT